MTSPGLDSGSAIRFIPSPTPVNLISTTCLVIWGILGSDRQDVHPILRSHATAVSLIRGSRPARADSCRAVTRPAGPELLTHAPEPSGTCRQALDRGQGSISQDGLPSTGTTDCLWLALSSGLLERSDSRRRATSTSSCSFLIVSRHLGTFCTCNWPLARSIGRPLLQPDARHFTHSCLIQPVPPGLTSEILPQPSCSRQGRRFSNSGRMGGMATPCAGITQHHALPFWHQSFAGAHAPFRPAAPSTP